MNSLTQHFHQAEFPVFVPVMSWQEIEKDFWQSACLPFVDTEIDFCVSSSYQWALDNPNCFDKDSRTEYFDRQFQIDGSAWYKETPVQGWHCCNVFGSNKGDDQHADDVLTRFWPDAFPDLRQQIRELGLPVTRLAVFKLDCNGYVQPHVDHRFGSLGGLNHVWLPLHEFGLSLKIYPYGYVNHQQGRAYLLNNPRYMHSVWNRDPTPRYIAAMTLDYHTMDAVLERKILEAAKKQWSRYCVRNQTPVDLHLNR